MNVELVIIFFIIIIIAYFFFKPNIKNVIYVKSDIDDELYLVRDLPDKKQAANILARIKQNINSINLFLYNNKKTKYKEYEPYIDQLHERIQNVIIMENDGDYKYTSYSVNKGEQLIFCLRSRDVVNNKLHEINLLMYVVLHEMSHIACPEVGHGPLFKKIFAFIAKIGVEQQLYTKIDFESHAQEYCGLMITDSII